VVEGADGVVAVLVVLGVDEVFGALVVLLGFGTLVVLLGEVVELVDPLPEQTLIALQSDPLVGVSEAAYIACQM